MPKTVSAVSLLVCFGALFPAALASHAQSERARIVERVDESPLKTLLHNTHPLARAQYEAGVAPDDLPMRRMLLVLSRSPEQESALQKLLDAQQDRTSPLYREWVTPDQFGTQFGASDADIQTVTAWLHAQGFTVGNVSRGKSMVEFSGTAGQVRNAFHTEIRQYLVNGVAHWANASDPAIPSALATVVKGVATLHNFARKPQHVRWNVSVPFSVAQDGRALYTTSSGEHALSPADYATIYNINPLYNAGINGTGRSIAIVSRTDILLSDISSFRSIFGLPANPPSVIVNGPDPGDLRDGDEAEAVLDVSWAGAIAPNATVKLVVSKTTNTTDGVDLSELYIIDNNLADVMSESYGDCEANYTQAEAEMYSNLAEQAAAQGITYLVASGDSGAEGCDDPGSKTVASGPVSVNILASTPYTVAVGGTTFNENGNSSYWNSSNATGTGESANRYIPEDVWNESCTAAACGAANANISAGSGGASTFFSKPSWQTGVAGIPTDGARDVPDVSLTSAGHDFYLLCLDGSCSARRGGSSFSGVSGTSAAAPSFAGIMALVVQKTGVRQGNANYVLYALAATQNESLCNASSTVLQASTCIFNDVTVGNNAVPGETGYGTATASYQAGVGYDLATGLGSVNAANLVNSWSSTASTGTPSLSVSATTLDFGTEAIGVPSAAQQVAISNYGTGTLFFSGFVSSGSTSDFSMSNGCGSALGPNTTCQLTVTFIPVGAGVRTAFLTIYSSDSNSPAQITLSGTGSASNTVSFSANNLDFGRERVGKASNAKSITIINPTGALASINGFSIAGANAGDFYLLSGCGTSLQSGASCTVSITFRPLMAGSRSASLIVSSVDASLALSGIATLDGPFEIVSAKNAKVLSIAGASESVGAAVEQDALNGGKQQQWLLIALGGGFYEIENANSGLALDVIGGATRNGALMQQYSYVGGVNQQWELIPADDVHYRITNRASGRVLDIPGGSSSDGTQIQQYDYVGDLQQLWSLVPATAYNVTNQLSGKLLDPMNASSSNGTMIDQVAATGLLDQQWQFVPTGGSYFAILDKGTGKVLDVPVASTSNGAIIQEYDFVGGTNQEWQIVPTSASTFEILNRNSSKVLDDSGLSLQSNNAIQQWDYLGGTNQQWQITTVTYYAIANKLSGMVLDVPGGSTSDGQSIQQWSANGNEQQSWELVPLASGAYEILNQQTNKALAVTSASTSNGAAIVQATYAGNTTQQWQLLSIPGGFYEIVNIGTGKALDVRGSSTSLGGAIQQWNYLGGTNQQWQIIPSGQ